MAYINRKEIKPKEVPYKRYSVSHASDYYNTPAWKRLRETYISLHPICEECLRHGIVTPAEHVHHRYFWDSFNTEELKWEKFLDEKNLCSCCQKCHYAFHNKARRYNISFCDSLTDKEYKEAHCI